MARSASPNQCAAFSIDSGGTPVISATFRGSHGCDEPRPRPRIRWCARSMNSRSSRPSRKMTCSIPISSARSVPGRTGKIQIGVARDGSHPRIGDDQLAAVVAAAPDVVGRDRGALADIRADDKQDFRLGDLAPWNRAAVDAERQLVGDVRPRPCRAGRCNRCGGCRVRRARICPSGTTSRS